MSPTRLLLLAFHVVSAGVQRGHCYCNVGVCYKRVDSETRICTEEEDFFGVRAPDHIRQGFKISVAHGMKVLQRGRQYRVIVNGTNLLADMCAFSTSD